MIGLLDWESRTVAPNRRARRWSRVSHYDWVTRVPDIDHGAVLVYGVITDRCGGGTMARHLSTTDIGRRLGRQRQWASARVTLLEELRLIRREPPGRGEKAPRYRVLTHPLMPGFFDDVDRGEHCLTHARRLLELWQNHAPGLGYDDDQEVVLRRFFDVINNGMGAELIWLRLKSYLASALPPNSEGNGLPGFWPYRTSFLRDRPDVKLFHLGWAYHCRHQDSHGDRPTFESATQPPLVLSEVYDDRYAEVTE